MYTTFEFVYELHQPYFSQFKIDLIHDNFINQINHEIHQNGWYIKYVFKIVDGNTCCEFYSNHRHPGPSFTRYFLNGTSYSAYDLRKSDSEYMNYKTLYRLVNQMNNGELIYE